MQTAAAPAVSLRSNPVKNDIDNVAADVRWDVICDSSLTNNDQVRSQFS